MTLLHQPFAELTPDAVMDAIDATGLRSDGRLLALNSYENRVYLVGVEDGPSVVVKFYRANRWSDAAILEEHAFVAELDAREIPVVPALTINDKTLHQYQGFRFSIFPKRGGRAPELDNRATLEWMGRFIGRIHAVGALERYTQRPLLDIATFGEAPSAYLLASDFLPMELTDAYRSVVEQALDGVRRCFDRAGDVKNATAATCCGPTTARILLILMTAVWDPRYRICG